MALYVTLLNYAPGLQDEVVELSVSASQFKDATAADYVKFGGFVYRNAGDEVHEGAFIAIHPLDLSGAT